MPNRMTVTAPSPAAAHADTDAALRHVAAVLADRDATVDQVMNALRDWSRIVLDQRERVIHPATQVEGQTGTRAGIQDVVSLSAQALARSAS